jgi:AraC family transcriptional activator of pobA
MINWFHPNEQAKVVSTSSDEWLGESAVFDFGAIVLCTSGTASFTVNFSSWHLSEGAVLALFPNDAVISESVSGDFCAEVFCYSEMMLREASLQIESAVYDKLRDDRCRTGSQMLTDIVSVMFHLLRLHCANAGVDAFRQIALLQLKAFLLGFYDFIYHHPIQRPEALGPQRAHELFQRFMIVLEHEYRYNHDVSYYADALRITPKYLNIIVHHATGNTTKEIIDHYLVMQLKLLLRGTQKSIKEIAWDYHFSNLSFFIRYFKKHTGMTPKQYKQNALR